MKILDICIIMMRYYITTIYDYMRLKILRVSDWKREKRPVFFYSSSCNSSARKMMGEVVVTSEGLVVLLGSIHGSPYLFQFQICFSCSFYLVTNLLVIFPLTTLLLRIS